MWIEKQNPANTNTLNSITKRNYSACEALKKILDPDVLAERLNANYIKDCFIHSGKKNSTLNEHRTRLFASLNWAYENDYIPDVSFLRKVKPFKSPDPERKGTKQVSGTLGNG